MSVGPSATGNQNNLAKDNKSFCGVQAKNADITVLLAPTVGGVESETVRSGISMLISQTERKCPLQVIQVREHEDRNVTEMSRLIHSSLIYRQSYHQNAVCHRTPYVQYPEVELMFSS